MAINNDVFYWNKNIPFSENKKKFLKFIVENVEEIADYPNFYDGPNETYILIQESRSNKIHIIKPGTQLLVKDKEGHFYTRRINRREGIY